MGAQITDDNNEIIYYCVKAELKSLDGEIKTRCYNYNN